MALDELERIRRRVEAGEALTEPEFRALEREAAASTGSTLRLALAHALSNAGRDRESLASMEVLRREFPADLPVQLGEARALAGLERYPEAEAALQRALTLNPDDPEALKSLALLSLRRGEPRRADALIPRALTLDPLDEEARLVREELRASELPAPQRVALKREFLAALRQRLSAGGLFAGEDGADVLIRADGGALARVSGDSLYGGYLSEGRPLGEAIAAMARQLAEQVRFPSTAVSLLERVLPVLREPRFAAQAPNAARREGLAGLEVFYVVEDPELVRYVPRTVLDALGVTLDALDAAAWTRLDQRPVAPRAVLLERGTPVLAERATGLWALATGDGHDGARLLCASQRSLLRAHAGEGPWRVWFGRREFALIARDGDGASEALSGAQPAPEGISGTFCLSGAGALSSPLPVEAGRRNGPRGIPR